MARNDIPNHQDSSRRPIIKPQDPIIKMGMIQAPPNCANLGQRLLRTSDGITVGAAGDGAGEHGDGAGRLRWWHCGRQADADGAGGASVHAQDHAALPGGGRRRVTVLVAAHLPSAVPLFPGCERQRMSQSSERRSFFFLLGKGPLFCWSVAFRRNRCLRACEFPN